MDNVTTQPKTGLAGNIPNKELDPFAQAETSAEAKQLLEKIEEKESGVVKPKEAQPIKPVAVKKETFLDRLLQNAGIKPQPAQLTNNTKTAQSSVSTKQTAPRIDVSKFTRAFLLMLILLVVCSGGYLFIFLTNIDTQLIKITLTGKVTDASDKKAIENAEIF